MKIDLSKLPEGTKWIAIDSDGEACAYRDEPISMEFQDLNVYSDGEGGCLGQIGYVHD